MTQDTGPAPLENQQLFGPNLTVLPCADNKDRLHFVTGQGFTELLGIYFLLNIPWTPNSDAKIL